MVLVFQVTVWQVINMRKLYLIFTALFVLLSWNLLVVFNQLTIGVSDNGSETSITLPYLLNEEESEDLFEQASINNVHLYKQQITETKYTIYTNDEQFYNKFSNVISTEEIKIFAKTYQIFLESPSSLSGTVNVKNINENFENYLLNEVTGVQINDTVDTPKQYYTLRFMYIMLIFLILAVCCFAFISSEFEKHKREILMYELNGNRDVLKREIIKLFVILEIVQGLLLLIIFGVNSLYELAFYIISFIITSLVLLAIFCLIICLYKTKVVSSFQKNIQTQRKAVSYIYLSLLSVLIIFISINTINVLAVSNILIGDLIAFQSKDVSIKDLYTTTAGLASEISLNTLETNELPEGIYQKVNLETNQVKINCNYAYQYLGVSDCAQGEYTSNEMLELMNSTENQLMIEPLMLSENIIINPDIIIEEPEVVTSGMYWAEPIENDYLNIKRNSYIFLENFKELAWVLFLGIIKLVVLLFTYKLLMELFEDLYSKQYSKIDSIKMINGSEFELHTPHLITMLISIIGLLSLYNLYNRIYVTANTTLQVAVGLLSCMIVVSFWITRYCKFRKLAIKNAKNI